MSDYGNRVLADGAIGYWPLEETSGLSAVDVVGAKNGTIAGGVTLNQAGAFSGSRAMTFNGSTGSVSIANTPTLQIIGDLTVALWLNLSLAARTTVLSKGAAAEFECTLETTGAVNFYNGGDSVISSAGAVVAGQWQHVVITRVASAKTNRIYVNGVLVKTGTYTAAIPTSTNPIYIGRDSAGSQWTNGTLDEVALYNTTLTATQIANQYQTTQAAGVITSYPWWLQSQVRGGFNGLL